MEVLLVLLSAVLARAAAADIPDHDIHWTYSGTVEPLASAFTRRLRFFRLV